MSLITPRYFLAPMAGYTDGAFRILCKEYGCQYTTTEFVSAEAVTRGGDKTFRLAKVFSEERPASIQIFGSEPAKMAQAAHILEKQCDAIDINFGCPAPKVTRSLGGAALLDYPEKIKAILEETVSTCTKPVTAKMRLGVKNKNNAVKIAQLIEKSGASRLTVHGRTLEQGYTGNADWQVIAAIKKELTIPVIGNGNVKDWESAKAMFEQTNVDGIAIGRSALGNPSIFQALINEKDIPVSLEEKIAMFLRYVELRKTLKLWESHGDVKAHALQFIRGFPDAAALRLKISQAKSVEEIVDALPNFP
ncbi:MAG: tRNA-dihydrouridine synthase family protein [Candidatus Micrarchaeota archaeon]|nr:tRNA-dihydrouridine synthase family protein [Candidatus Micrarchaeota archaeon]